MKTNEFKEFTDQALDKKMPISKKLVIIGLLIKLTVVNLPLSFWYARKSINRMGMILLTGMLLTLGIARTIDSFALSMLFGAAVMYVAAPLIVGAIGTVAESAALKRDSRYTGPNGQSHAQQLALKQSSVTFLVDRFATSVGGRNVIIPVHEQIMNQSSITELTENDLIKPSGTDRWRLTELGEFILKTALKSKD